jgi:polynucleotide 5'-kinase involved in rRNA processing
MKMSEDIIREEQIRKSLSICVVGQVKSGKSSFYNTLFNKKIFPKDQQQCTYGNL